MGPSENKRVNILPSNPLDTVLITKIKSTYLYFKLKVMLAFIKNYMA